MNKNICFANSYTFWGGGEKSYFQYGRLLSQRKNKIFYLIRKDSELNFYLSKEDWPIIKFINTHANSQYDIILFFKLFYFFKTNRIDVLFVNSHRDWKATGIPAKLAGVSKIIYTKGTSDSIGMSFSRRFFFKYIINYVLVKSNDSKNKLLKTDGILMKDKIIVIKNGINIENYVINKYDLLYKKKDNEIIFGVSCRLEKVKRVSDLIQSVYLMKQKYNQPIKLLIAGKGSEKDNIIRLIKELELLEDVILLDFVSDIDSFLSSIDIFVYASEMEGLSNGIMEAMAFGLPIICYNISSMPELVKDGYNGFLIKPFNIEELTEKMHILSQNYELRKKLGNNSKQIIKKEFDINLTIDNYEKLIN